MTVHEMRLHPGPYHKIAEGTKTIEVRLNDEKRQLMKVGDRIEFSLRPDFAEKFQAEITALDTFASFKEAYEAYPPEQYGAESTDEWSSMYQYYSLEEESKFGILSIHLKRRN